MKRTYDALRMFAMRLLNHAGQTFPRNVGVLVLTWTAGDPVTPVATVGHAEAGRDVPRMLREVADSIEKQQTRVLT